MTRRSRTLDAALLAALAEFSAARLAGRVENEVLADVEASLATLSPADVSWADLAIATAAQLWRRPERRTSLMSFFQPHTDDINMLEKNKMAASIFLFHRDGFVRERALNSMTGGLTSGFMVAAMAWRLNDWVRPVRLAARLSFERALALTQPDVVSEAAPYPLSRWKTWQRWDPEQAVVLDRLFSRPDVVSAIGKRLREATSGPLAQMLRQMLRSPALDDDLIILARSAAEPAVRATAFHTLLDGEARWPVGFGREWVDKSFGIDRRVTLFGRRHITARTDKDKLLRQGLRDSSVAVRLLAADYLTKRADYRNYPPPLRALRIADSSGGWGESILSA